MPDGTFGLCRCDPSDWRYRSRARLTLIERVCCRRSEQIATSCELVVEGVIVVGVVVEVDGALLSPPEHAADADNSAAKMPQPAALLRH
jgi:hypothetical protein